MVSVVIPANDEMNSIGDVIQGCKRYCEEIIVVDDGSTDETARVSREHGARVIQNGVKLGIVKSTEIGFKSASGNIVVTLDADGQHDPAVIPIITKPIVEGAADLVLGIRVEARPTSERILAKIIGLRVKCVDPRTGCRALRAELARNMHLWGFCLCGSLVLEAYRQAARIVEVPIRIRPRIYGKSHWSPLSKVKVHLTQACLLLFQVAKGD